MISLEDRL